MKILFVSAVLPYPLFSGGQVRIYNLLKRLSLDHEITLVAFIRDDSERKYLKDLVFCHDVYVINRGRAWQFGYIIKTIFTRLPFLLSTYTNSKMYALLQNLLKEHVYDCIHLEPFYVWLSIPNTSIPIVVSQHNIEYEVYGDYVKRFPIAPLRPLLGIDIDKLKRFERYVWRSVKKLTGVSLHDCEVMESYLGYGVSLVANGVDQKSFAFRKFITNQEKTILFVGNFRWLPNIEAAKWLLSDIWPRIKRQFPQASLRIVGKNMPESIKAQSTDKIHCVDTVFDITKEYANAYALVAPMTISGGTKFKILEAMASGVPVISTKEGIEGIECEDDTHVLLANSSQSFVDQIIRLDTNKPFHKTLIHNARKLIETSYDWDIIAKDLERVWRDACEK